MVCSNNGIPGHLWETTYFLNCIGHGSIIVIWGVSRFRQSEMCAISTENIELS